MERDGGSNTIGNITKVTEIDSSAVTYSYDALYRLTAEGKTGTGAYTKSYGYDLAGNVTSLDGSTFATYDSANKLATVSSGTAAYTASGNLSSFTKTGSPTNALQWNSAELLTNNKGTSTTTAFGYGYDAFNRRVVSIEGSTVSTKRVYVYLGEMLVGEILAGSPKIAYTSGPGGLISQRDIGSSSSRWYHYGPQGETRALTNSSGTVTDSYRYTAYGVPLSATGSSYNPYRYGGKYGYYTQGDSGLIKAGARWYHPYTFRWVSRDPIKYRGGGNLFEYVSRRPVNFVDPTGLKISFHDYSEQDMRTLREIIRRVRSTKRGREIWDLLLRDPRNIKITKDRHCYPNFNPNTNRLWFDPNFLLPLPGYEGVLFSPERILAHEAGHAATGTADSGPGLMDNVNQNENPVAEELGEPPRKQYYP